MAHADWAFALDRPNDKGETPRHHLESVWRQTGKKPKRLDGPALPGEAAYLWAWFHELAQGRPAGGFGPARLGWADILAWCRLMDVRPEPWEIQALMRLDTAWLVAMTEPKSGA